MSRFDRHTRFLIGHELLMGVIASGGDATRWQELDQIGAAALGLALAQTPFLRSVDDAVLPVGVGKILIEPIPRVAMSCRRPERLERHPQPRSWDFAVIDGVADRDCLGSPAHAAPAREA